MSEITTQIIPADGWWAGFDMGEGRFTFDPLVAWALKEGGYIDGMSCQGGIIDSAGDVGDFMDYYTTKEMEHFRACHPKADCP